LVYRDRPKIQGLSAIGLILKSYHSFSKINVFYVDVFLSLNFSNANYSLHTTL
jgi:hypothetical protein